MRNIFCLSFACVVVSFAVARASGVTIRGGGHAVEVGANAYLLDLFEKGNERAPAIFVSHLFPLRGDALDDLTNVLPDLDQTQVLAKIMDIAFVDPVLAGATLKTIEALTWVMVDRPLVTVDADTDTHITVKQVALRTYNQVSINRRLWKKMDRDNRVALIIHEALAALAEPGLVSAQPVRTLTANLFDSSYLIRDRLLNENDLQFFPSIMKFAHAEILGQRPFGSAGDVLMSDADVGPLLATDQRPVSAKTEIDSIEYRFTPILRLTWLPVVDGTPSWQNGTQTETRFLRSTLMAGDVPELSACKTPATDKKLVSIEVGFTRVEVEADSTLHNGSPEPRYLWRPVYHTRSVLSFAGAPSPFAADCSASDGQQLAFIITWLSQFHWRLGAEVSL